MLPGSPFGGVSGADGLSIDLSESFLYAANNTANTVSGFQVDRTSGALTQLPDSPYPPGTGPTSITVVNNLQYEPKAPGRPLNPKRDGTVESHPSSKCAETMRTRGITLRLKL